jgi:hypothetical protein
MFTGTMRTVTSTRRRGGRVVFLIAALAILTASAQAWGQTSNATQWQRGTTLSGFAGAGSADGTTAALGTALGWEVVPHLTIEGRGVWLPSDHDSTDFFASLGALVPFRLGAVAPYLSAGIGMYRATVDAGASDVPEFYARRLNGRTRATFEDFSTALGAGTNVFVTSHVAIRPEISVILMTGEGERRTVTLYGVNVAYHFERHKAP